jgi:phospholipid transport system transporter-binding protein
MADITLPNIIQIANKWHISGDVLMDNANQILVESNAFLMDEDEIEIDFSEVEKVDTAAISLMLEWQRRAAASYCQVTFTHVPANLSSLAALYGVTEFIPLGT